MITWPRMFGFVSGALFATTTFCLVVGAEVEQPLELLPKFAGRVLPGDQVRPGTFTVVVPFDNISSWGPDGIMSYRWSRDFSGGGDVLIQAWRPDEQTPGVFQYAERRVGKINNYLFCYSKVAKCEDGWLFLEAGREFGMFALGYLVSVLFALFAAAAQKK